MLTAKKGIFIDGHEHDDDVESRKLFLQKMVKLGFHRCQDAVKCLPAEIDSPTNERRSKTVIFFHYESTFTANEDQPTQWGMKGDKMLKKESKGAAIMGSDFIDEHNGFMALSDKEQHQAAKVTNPNIAREFLEYGESKEGYWTRDKFIASSN